MLAHAVFGPSFTHDVLSQLQWGRRFTTDTKTRMDQPKQSGAGLSQRVSSFLVGAGLSALASQYYIYQELVNGNAIILKKQKELDARLSKVEK